MEEILSSIYYNPSKPGSFSGASLLLKEAKKTIPSARLKDIKNFLGSKDAYTLHKNIRYKFKRVKTRAFVPNQYWQMDLSDVSRYSSYNDGHRFILFIIDVYTRYLWVYILKNKKPASVSKALIDLLQKENTQPGYIWCDRGNEFVSGEMKKLFSDLNIGVIHTYGASKAGIVERVQRTIKTRLHRYFTFANTYKYTDVLQKLIDSYNNTQHRTIGIAPALLYSGKVGIKDNNKKILLKVRDNRLIPGAFVRINRSKRLFTKGFHRGWSEEVFKIKSISQKHNVPLFYIRDLNGEDILGAFYENEVQFIEDKANKLYKIEKILKTIGRGKHKIFLVKWEGYLATFNSYVNAKDISTSLSNDN